MLTLCSLIWLAGESAAWSQEIAESDAPQSQNEQSQKDLSQNDQVLRFAFEGTPWRDVVSWLAEESGSALHVSDLPTGSFTYSDPNAFSPQSAVDRVNLFLLPQGFTIVRSGKLMSIINLADPRSMQQLDAMAKLVAPKDLDTQADHDVVKCIFPLGELKPEDAVQELTALNLMTSPSVFEKTKRLLVTDSVSKLKNVRAILDAFQPDTMDNGTIVKSFTLAHVDAEDVLEVARPHLGLATGEMIGIDVSISADTLGKNIFVTGVEDKVAVIERLIEAVDRPKESLSPTDSENELRSHAIQTGNIETVYNVLQTLLAGRTARISMDETAGAIVALADPKTHAEIEATITQLKASDADFAVIELEWIDSYYAVSLLEGMLDLNGERSDDQDFAPPRIDADPQRRRLFVRGKQHQIDQVRTIVEGLDVSTNATSADEIRIFPLKGDQADRVLKTAAKFWDSANPIVLYLTPGEISSSVRERVIGKSQSDVESGSTSSTDSADFVLTASGSSTGSSVSSLLDQAQDQVLWLAGETGSNSEMIRCQKTQRGLLLQCSNTEALDKFENHLQTIAGPMENLTAPPTVYYLKFTKSDDALKMLAELLDGGEAAQLGESGSLVNSVVSMSVMNSTPALVMTRDGTLTLNAGSLTVVSEPRLNRLIAQGSTGELERIEDYLEIVDREGSITSVETYGTSRVIELKHARASAVAESIQGAFANYMAAKPTSRSGSSRSDSDRGRSESDDRRARDDGGDGYEDKRGSSGSSRGKTASGANTPPSREPKLLVSVHEASNSLIVTAPPDLFAKVQRLAEQIDSQSEQTVQILTPVNGEAVESMLKQMLLGEKPTARPRPTSDSSRREPASSRRK